MIPFRGCRFIPQQRWTPFWKSKPDVYPPDFEAVQVMANIFFKPHHSLQTEIINRLKFHNVRFHARVYLENPDIIAITESWLDDSFNAGEIFPSEYSVFRNDRNTHGGGVALGIKCYLNPVLRPEFLSSNIEIVWAELTTTRGKCLFGVYYRPPSQNKNRLEILDENLCKIQASNRSYELYTLVGDFNIHIDWVSDMNVIKGALPRTLIDTMNSSGFTQVLKEPTYRTRNGVDFVQGSGKIHFCPYHKIC